MKTVYEVTVRATITKTYTVEAENLIDAQNMANEIFTTDCDGTPEDYDQDVIDICEAE